MSMNDGWSETDRARMAAYLDTIGSISINKQIREGARPSYTFQVKVGCAGIRKLDVLKWLANMLSTNISRSNIARVCIMDLSTKKKRKYESSTTRFTITREKAYNFLHTVYPYTLVHREEADAVFVFYTHYVLRNHRTPTPAEQNIAEECYQKMRAIHRSKLVQKLD